MKYLLDTDHISILQRRAGAHFEAMSRRIDQLNELEYGVSIVSFHEQTLGAHAFINQATNAAQVMRGYRMFNDILDAFTMTLIADYDVHAADEYGKLRAMKLRVATMDLRIAALALSLNATLVTRNAADFSKVPNLRIEDWTT